MTENTRDYYADLELPATADVQEIKKQFRKLALKYHPDRNREGDVLEANSKFQLIQSAHEVLGDPDSKAKYDASRGRSNRYPGSSGVRGNPWQKAGQEFPPPPRRNPAGSSSKNTASGGAQRWQDRFAQGVPPTAKQYTSADPETKKNAAKAFESMRNQAKANAKNGTRPVPPTGQAPPPPPRSATARQRAEASFGTRKTSAQARPPSRDDAGNMNASTAGDNQYQRPVPAPPPRPQMPDPLSQFREAANNQADSRQSMPYTTHGGERIDPFDGTPANRTKSSRQSRRTDSGSSGRKDRRSSVQKNKEGQPAGASNPQNGTHSTFQAAQDPNVPYEGSHTDPTGTDGPSMYGIPFSNEFSSQTQNFHNPERDQSITSRFLHLVLLSHLYHTSSSCSWVSSGCPESQQQQTNSFDRHQHNVLSQLIENKTASRLTESINTPNTTNINTTPIGCVADMDNDNSFNFQVNEDTFVRTSPAHATFAKTSFDDINTQFVDENGNNTWQFNAGSPLRQSPVTDSPTKQPNQGEYRDANDGFNPTGWADKFGPQTFEPRPNSATVATSPTRASRTSSKKGKGTKGVPANATVIDITSDDDLYEWNGRKSQKDGAVESPQAMEIDSPPARGTGTVFTSNTARNIPLEPTRPEWRSGIVDVGDGISQNHAKANNIGGSEDSEEFRANFADLKNVPPFAQSKSGLKSFLDLKDNLPFESKASENVQTKLQKVQKLIFPTPPTAPVIPATVLVEGMRPNAGAWHKYLEAFESYLREWEAFNTKVVDHFSARNSHISKQREFAGYQFLISRAEHTIQEYSNWIEQDNDVRRRWNVACDRHEDNFRDFMAFRAKMK